jgi:hypothetical protein
MDLVEKHRTFLFIDDVAREGNGFPAFCGRQAERMEVDGIGIGPGEGRLDLSIRTAYDHLEEPAISVVGRSTFPAWNGKPGDFYRFEALTYPEFRKFTMMTWKDQNFLAFATWWEAFNSPVLKSNSPLTPLVDNCGVLVGYFQQGVSAEYLFATPEGEIFYAINVGSYMTGSQRIWGRDLWLSDAGQVTTGAAVTQSKHRIPAGNKADIIVDIDGFVLAINMYLDPPMSERGAPSNSPIVALIGQLVPTIPKVSEACMPGGSKAGSEECAQEHAEMVMDAGFLVFDILSLGTSAIARKLALKLLRIGRGARKAAKALKGKAGELLAKRGGAVGTATSLGLDLPQLGPVSASPAGGRKGKLLLEGTASDKKAKFMEVELGPKTGMTHMAIRDVRYKMQKHGVRVRFRPAGTARKLRKRDAVPKWEELKMKTINDDDILLGAPKAGKSQPGYFKPKLPDPALEKTNKELFDRLMKRYKQREEEFRELAEKVEKYKKDGEIVVENGVVKDGPTGKDIAGDYDIFEILDKHGKRITDADPRYNKILDDLRGRRIGVQHGAHVEWKPTDPFEKKIYQEIIERHRTKEPLYEFREDGSVWETFAD